MTSYKLGEADKTPAHPMRVLSGTALCLLDLAQTARAAALAIDRGNVLTRAALGRRLVDMGRDFVAIGNSLVDKAAARPKGRT